MKLLTHVKYAALRQPLAKTYFCGCVMDRLSEVAQGMININPPLPACDVTSAPCLIFEVSSSVSPGGYLRRGSLSLAAPHTVRCSNVI